MWSLSWFKRELLLVACVLFAGSAHSASSADSMREEIAAQRLKITAEIDVSEAALARKQAECATRFIVTSCVNAAKSTYYNEQQLLNKKLAAVNKRERELDAAERAKARAEQQAEQAVRLGTKPAESMTPAQRDTAAGSAASAAAYAAKQVDAKQRKAEHEAKLKAAVPTPKPAVVPRSANAAEMAAAATKAQAKQKEIADRKAAIDKKKAEKHGAPLPLDPPLDPLANPPVK
jgi:colicin import membrane protein